MLLRAILLLALASGLVALAVPAGAEAASPTQILRDCEDDSRFSGSYTPKELRDARDRMGSDQAVYGDCADVLSAALAGSARERARQSGADAGGGAGGGGGNAGSDDPAGSASGGTRATTGGDGPNLNRLDTEEGARNSPVASQDDLKALRSTRENLPEVHVRGQRIVPGVRGVAGSAASATVPTSLVVVLVLLGVTAVLALVPLARRRVLGRRAG